MYIEDILELIDGLEGAGLTVTDSDLLAEELEVQGFQWRMAPLEDIENDEDEDYD